MPGCVLARLIIGADLSLFGIKLRYAARCAQPTWRFFRLLRRSYLGEICHLRKSFRADRGGDQAMHRVRG